MNNKTRNIILTVSAILCMFILGDIAYLFSIFLKNKELSIVVTNILYLGLLIFIYSDEFKKSFKDLKKNWKNILKTGFKYWGLGILMMIVSNIIINFIIFDGTIAANEELVRETILGSPLYGFVSAVVLAPFIEEILFRISIRRNINNTYLYAFTSALIFGLMHALSGITGIIDLIYIIPYGALGYAFAMMYVKTENVFASIFIHGIHNFITILLIFKMLG